MRKAYVYADTGDEVPFSGRWISMRSLKMKPLKEGEVLPTDEDGEPTMWRLSVRL